MDKIPKNICIVDFHRQRMFSVSIVLYSMLGDVTSTSNVVTR